MSNAWLETLPELIAEAAARGPAAIRWTAFRKELVVKAIHSRQLSHDVAFTVFGLGDEELRSWEARYLAHGAKGLKATRIQLYGAPAAADRPIGAAG